MHTALGSLQIEDLLVGARCPPNRFLASSSAGAEALGETLPLSRCPAAQLHSCCGGFRLWGCGCECLRSPCTALCWPCTAPCTAGDDTFFDAEDELSASLSGSLSGRLGSAALTTQASMVSASSSPIGEA